MKKLIILAALALAACSGGGSGGGLVPTPHPSSTPTPQTKYSLQLHWEPASSVGLTALTRTPSVRVVDTGVPTVVIESVENGNSPYDIGSPAYVTVSVDPQPSPGADIQITTDSPVVVSHPTPAPPVPNPSASPAVVLVAERGSSDHGHTVTADYNGFSTTNNLLVIPSLALVAPKSGSPTLPDAIGFAFDANCNAIPQTDTGVSDIYITGPNDATITYPGGGTAVQHGFDVSTLTTADFANNGTSIGLDAFANAFDDTLIFQAASGKIVYLHGDSFGGSGPTSSAAFIDGGYGCLN